MLTPDTLREVWALLPYTAQALVGCIGAEAAIALLEARCGCAINVPKHADRHPDGKRRWAELSEIIGEPAMQQLAARWGGDALEIPTCKDARRETRDRTIRSEFDRMSLQDKCSKAQAIYALGLQYKMTSRQLEKIVDQSDAEAALAQGVLF